MPSLLDTLTGSCDLPAQRAAEAQQLAEPTGELVGKDAKTTGVLHVINGQYFAGAERVQDLLAQRLPAEGFHVGFACVKPGQFASSRRNSAPLYNVPMANRDDIRAAAGIARIAQAGRYRLIHAHTVRTAMVGRIASLLADLPMVYHVHSPTARNTTRPLLNRIAAMVERWSLAGAAHLIAVSESLARHMQSHGFARERISVVHNGVPGLERLPERPRPQGKWNIGVVALFRPRKGIEVLLRALALLKEEGAAFKLHAIGNFEDEGYQRQLALCAAEMGLAEHVLWRGFVQDVTAELLRLDMLVLPSLFGEGLPMVVLEAMAAGVPVVATDVEGVGEAIRHGQEGIIVPPGNPAALASGIRSMIAGEISWSELRAAAWRRQQEMFSDHSMAAGVAEVYRNVLQLSEDPHT
jgi:glycosyltransferase involved in cell wall biosynthesis